MNRSRIRCGFPVAITNLHGSRFSLHEDLFLWPQSGLKKGPSDDGRRKEPEVGGGAEDGSQQTWLSICGHG